MKRFRWNLFSPKWGRKPRFRKITVTLNDDIGSDNYNEYSEFYQGDFASVLKSEEARMLTNQLWNIYSQQNGRVRVTTWDQPEFSVKLCKAVAVNKESEGREILGEIKLVIEGSTISVKAPETHGRCLVRTWLVVKAPKEAAVSLKVYEGGAMLDGFSGTANVEVTSGGISLNQSTGKLTVEAKNGGVSIRDCGGDVTAKVGNGGLTIALPERWEGKGLQAYQQSGGLVFAVPRNFDSGLEITSASGSPLACQRNFRDKGRQAWEGGGWIFRLGGEDSRIRARLDNGPVTIREREESMERVQ